jgi:hypothetical protein
MKIKSRILVLAIVMATSATSVVGSENMWEIYGISVPKLKRDTFTSGKGIEAKYRTFVSERMSIDILLGLTEWTAKSQSLPGLEIAGEVQDLNVGLGLTYDVKPFSFEFAIKHHVMNSDVDAVIASPLQESELVYDNITTFEVGVNYLHTFTKNVTGIIGVRYQWELFEGDVMLNHHEMVQHTSIEGMVFRAGLVIQTR